jgi:hypothetical protein
MKNGPAVIHVLDDQRFNGCGLAVGGPGCPGAYGSLDGGGELVADVSG